MASANGVVRRGRGLAVDLAGVEAPARRGKAPAAAKPDKLLAWAKVGVAGTLVLSAGLNGWAFAEHAPAAWAGWLLGVAIPALVLVFSRVSALCWGRGWRRLAYCGAGVTLSMLLLSVQHCAWSISRLTGEHVGLAALMALAIDAGLVVCELATVRR